MGAGSSVQTLVGDPNTSDCLANFYRKYCAKTGAGHDTPHMSGYKLGGLADTEKYASSAMSTAKQQLIKDIASDLAEKIKVPKLNPKGKSLDEVIAELKMHVPDPRKGKGNKKIWSEKEGNQVAACKIMAEVINHRMNEEVINPKGKPGDICEEVAEVMHSLLTGMHAEFVGVRKDVERILKNINLLMTMLDRQHAALESKIAADKESNVRSETAVLREAHKDVVEELNRHVAEHARYCYPACQQGH
jgi:hypothetical protein